MSTKMKKIIAATVLGVPLTLLATPAALAESASVPAHTSAAAATPVAGGSVHLCFPLGSVVWCI
ncbi:hypothetical protein [Nocardia miyunensis]|uniref:hypothetical protein n=1 Tax=Nocardia miyunensis TaxID=282684 RepID=UPI000A9D1059|nr:hypothetical protein [Nocardia miyunensis]